MTSRTRRFAGMACAALISWDPAAAQVQAALTFEAASIKRHEGQGDSGSSGFLPGGRYAATNQTIDALIRVAYPETRGGIVGLPDWASMERYDVSATAGRPTSRSEIALMMRALLEERLKMLARVERRDTPIFALVVAREDGQLGPALKRFTQVCGAPAAPVCGLSAGPGGVKAVGVPLSGLASVMTVSAGRPLEDRTGLSGPFEFTLVYAPQSGRPRDPQGPVDTRPDVFTALREQLGLALQPARGLLEVVVVDRLERPTPD